jgi:hypothetical protein
LDKLQLRYKDPKYLKKLYESQPNSLPITCINVKTSPRGNAPGVRPAPDRGRPNEKIDYISIRGAARILGINRRQINYNLFSLNKKPVLGLYNFIQKKSIYNPLFINQK